MKALFRLALLILLFSSVPYFFSYPDVDPDLWGHLYFGREILQQGKLPAVNLYSYTAPDHPWINHEWLAEIILYWLFDQFGTRGLILFKLALGGTMVWILDRIMRKRVGSRLSRAITAVWTMAILSPGFNVRPQILSYFLFTVFLYLFHLFEDNREKALYGIAPLMSLWVNLHGGFVVGLGALALFSSWSGARAMRDGRRSGGVLFDIIIPSALSLLLLPVNPYGLDLLSFLSRDLLLHRPITEWEPILLTDFSYLEFKLALIVLILAVRKSWWRWDFTLALLAALFAVRHQRHIPLFAIAAVPLLAEGIEPLGRIMERKAREWILAGGLLAASLYLFLASATIHWQHGFQLIVNPNEFPTQAADFLHRNGVRGNLAVPFDWGEFLIWHLYPEIRVSVDGRYTTAYPMEVIEDNFEWMRGGKGWRRLFERYPTDIAITHRKHPVTALMRRDSEWVYIYSDPIAFVFVREGPAQAGLLQRFRQRRLLPPAPLSLYFPG